MTYRNFPHNLSSNVSPDAQNQNNMNLLNLFKNDHKHFKLHISGEVQKVGFRRYARRQAKELGLSGFVQYYYDDLYMEIEGKPNLVQSFVDDCRMGPSKAQVEEFQMEEGKYQGFGRFKILRSIR